MRIAIFGKSYASGKQDEINTLFSSLQKYSPELLVDREFLRVMQDMDIRLPEITVLSGNDFYADISLSLGGDGTFLKTAERIGDLTELHIRLAHELPGFFHFGIQNKLVQCALGVLFIKVAKVIWRYKHALSDLTNGEFLIVILRDILLHFEHDATFVIEVRDAVDVLLQLCEQIIVHDGKARRKVDELRNILATVLLVLLALTAEPICDGRERLANLRNILLAAGGK